ncbi:G-PROTEIN-RECEP-F1-2 domain-containing protein [Aphelenchoides besseyi]|nr:G-PROTEIN-RECEP-F1-2 domain-containing protein [Aphelenchoides besseyi]KAI6199373.1 G-PROTEIN-RECEP-F1-2 domain-containing protein [Aphelenchoides besseyi]
MQDAPTDDEMADFGDYYNENPCQYDGTDFVEVKIYLIGVVAVFIALSSLIFNTFFVIVFIRTPSLRQSPLFYFGALASLDIILALNYLALMVVPVYFDQWHLYNLYVLFLSYLRPMMMISFTSMFASMLLIVAATVERLMRTFKPSKFLNLIENHRPAITVMCIFVAIAYKICTYFEIHFVVRPNCTDFSKYEIQATQLATNETYRFWWIFITRNIVDRIAPFFILVVMNVLIIRNLKQVDSADEQSLSSMTVNERANKRVVRDATRALIAMLSLFLIAQLLQVIITIWEYVHRESLDELFEFYSYANDIISILALLSSAARFPCYCAVNRPIFVASSEALRQLKEFLCDQKEKEQWKSGPPSQRITIPLDGNTVIRPIHLEKNGGNLIRTEELYLMRASLNDSEEEQWMV